MIHELKTNTNSFIAMVSGAKNFEIRFNDRDFKVGDQLLLKEFIQKGENNPLYYGAQYTGRILHRRVDFILEGGRYGIEHGFVILSLSKI